MRQKIIWGFGVWLCLYAKSIMAVEQPSWWLHPDRGIINTNMAAQDRAAANQGQLKYVAAKTAEEFQYQLPDADLSAITNLVNGFSSTNNRAPVNLRSLKRIAQPFYDVLHTNRIYPWPEKMAHGPYPWSESTNVQDNAMANLGQLKYVFSFDFDSGYRVDLDVDTDRDGIVENNDEDEIGEDAWTSTKGAIYNVNFDADGGREEEVKGFGEVPIPDAIYFTDDEGKPIYEDYDIENEEDAKDIAPLVIRRIHPEIPDGWGVFLRVDGANSTNAAQDIQRIHVYPKIEDGAESIWGSMTTNEPAYKPAYTNTEINITDWVSSTNETTFGIEGLSFRNLVTNDVIRDYQQFDGYIDFTLELRDGTNTGASVISSDSVRMKVAPWMMISAAEPSEEVWAILIDDDKNNYAFLYTNYADLGYFALDASGQLNIVSNNVNSGHDLWVQDQIETGFTQRPGGPPTYIIFQFPYFDGGTREWHYNELLTTNMGIFQLGEYLGGSSADSGGNLEILPPDDEHKLGIIEFGNSNDFYTVSERLQCFLESQEVQDAQFNVDLSKVNLGHIASITAFWKHETTNVVIIADPTAAWELLTDAPSNGVFFATGATTSGVVRANSSNDPDRIYTGIDHTKPNSPAWNYIRIYASTNADTDAVGTMLEIDTLENGYITISDNWGWRMHVTSDGSLENMDENLANSRPKAGDEYVLFQDTKNFDQTITTAEFLGNEILANINTNIMQAVVDAARTTLGGASTNLVFIKVPNLFVYYNTPEETPLYSSFHPAPAVLQALNTNLYMPRQFGPRNADGEDIFEEAIEEAIACKLGVTNIVRFVDSWDNYNAGDGGVQCGTEVRRSIPTNWWEQLE